MFAENFLRQWVLSPRMFEVLLRAYVESQMILSSEERKILSKNSIFKDKYKGKRCFVIGNGPSLNNQDLTPLKGEITIVMNHFHQHPILQVWQPTFWCLADPANCYTPEEITRVKEGMIQANPEAFFIPICMKKLDEIEQIFPQGKTYFVKMAISPQYWNKNKKWEFTSVIPGARSTAHLALYLALYLGCSPIYLLGLDNDWLSHRSVYRHFYSDSKNDSEDESCNLSKQSYKVLMENTLQHWIIFERIQDYATKKGIKIYNATEGGFLDVFPDINYLDCLKQS